MADVLAPYLAGASVRCSCPAAARRDSLAWNCRTARGAGVALWRITGKLCGARVTPGVSAIRRDTTLRSPGCDSRSPRCRSRRWCVPRAENCGAARRRQLDVSSHVTTDSLRAGGPWSARTRIARRVARLLARKRGDTSSAVTRSRCHARRGEMAGSNARMWAMRHSSDGVGRSLAHPLHRDCSRCLAGNGVGAELPLATLVNGNPELAVRAWIADKLLDCDRTREVMGIVARILSGGAQREALGAGSVRSPYRAPVAGDVRAPALCAWLVPPCPPRSNWAIVGRGGVECNGDGESLVGASRSCAAFSPVSDRCTVAPRCTGTRTRHRGMTPTACSPFPHSLQPAGRS